MPFSGMHVHVALIQPICAKLVMHSFLWVIGHMSDGQHQCFAKQDIRGDLVVPFQFCCTVSRTFCLSIAVRPVGGRIGRHVFVPSVFTSCIQTSSIGLFCTCCTAVGASLGECTRTIASEHTLIIFTHSSTSHANRVQFEATQYQCGLPLTSLSICRGRCISWCVVLSSQLRLTSLQSVCSTRTYAIPSPNLLTLCK